MLKWHEGVRFQVLDLTNPAEAAFVRPGFYWLIPLPPPEEHDPLPEDRHISIVGPFETSTEARDDALSWIHHTLSAPEIEFKEAA